MPTSKTITKDANSTEQSSEKALESIQMFFELTSRIDERVKMIIEKQKSLEEHIDKLLNRQDDIIHRIALIESKDINSVHESLHSLKEKIAVIVSCDTKKDLNELKDKIYNLEIKSDNTEIRMVNHDNKWSIMFDSVWKIALMCIAGYILYKLGLQSPP